MAALPYMQLYIADYLADTMHLSTEEHGAYLLLMFNYWQTARPIPKTRLAKIARIPNDRWHSVESSLQEFFNDTGTEWVHERIQRDLDTVRASIEQKSAAGKASAAKKKSNKLSEGQRESNDRSTGVEIPLEQEGNGEPTNKDLYKDKDLKPKEHMSDSENPPNQTSLPGDKKYPDEFEILWVAYPKRSGSNSKSGAFKSWKARRKEGIPDVAMLEAVRRYHAYCTAEKLVGTKFVKLTQTFLGPDHEFDNPWEATTGGAGNAQNTPGTGGPTAASAVRAERERIERQHAEQGRAEHMDSVGNPGRNIREPLGNEEWVKTINAMGDTDFRNDN